MSTLKVDTIQKADGTGSLSVPAESGTVVTTASPSLGRRNLIINGAMQVGQRGTNWANTTASTYYLDRWKHQNRQSSVTDIDLIDNQDIGDGIMNVYKITVDTPPTDTNFLINQFIENGAYTVLGKDITISWYARQSTGSGVTTNVAVEVDGGSTYTSTGSDNNLTSSWQRFTQTFTVSGYTAADVTDPSFRFQLFFKGLSSADVVEVTGVQLEVGSVATPFEHRSYGEELALCQRYYETGKVGWEGYAYNTANYEGQRHSWVVEKRAAPSASVTTDVQSGYSGGGQCVGITNESAHFKALPTASGGGKYITMIYTADSEL